MVYIIMFRVVVLLEQPSSESVKYELLLFFYREITTGDRTSADEKRLHRAIE